MSIRSFLLYCALWKEVQSCANLAHILHIEERGKILHKSCAYIAYWRNNYNLRKSCAYIAYWRNKYNLVQILCIYCALEKEVQSCTNLAYILHIGEITTILHKSCGYIVHH